MEQEKKKKTEKKKFGIIYNFYYENDNESINALTNLSFFINRTLDNTLWKKPKDRNKKLFYIFIINTPLNGFIIPNYDNVVVIENYDNDMINTETLFVERFRMEVENILTMSTVRSQDHLLNQVQILFGLIISLHILVEELNPIFSKTTTTTLNDINPHYSNGKIQQMKMFYHYLGQTTLFFVITMKII